MTLPLAVRLGNEVRTREIDGLSFRKEAIGGVQNISFRLALPLDRTDVVKHFDTVTIFNAATAETIATGYLADLGRGVSADGQRWAATAFGPADHVNDTERPLIYVTQSLEQTRQVNRMNRGMIGQVSTKPDNANDDSPDGLLFHAPEGTTLATNDTVTLRYDGIRDAGMALGRLSFSADGGSIDTDYDLKLLSSVDGSGGSVHFTFSMSTTAVTGNAEVVTTDFTNGRNVFDFWLERSTGSGKPANDNKWAFVYDLIVRARLMDETGADITAGASYGNDYVLAHEVVKDLLGRCLPEYDGATAYIDTAATHHIDSLSYPDGVTPGVVLDDLMGLERAYRWWVTNDGQFRWEPWPTTVRYEATLDDGGDFPTSVMEVYNEVTVRYRNKRGRTLSATYTSSGLSIANALDGTGRTRRKLLDLADEVASSGNAARRAENFLRDHAYPANAGRLNVARPIRDLSTGRMVEPWEIEPGNLVRVRGVESYPDALNASSSDGLTVFRIWAMEFSGDTASSVLELDTYPRNTWAALRRLGKKRSRKR